MKSSTIRTGCKNKGKDVTCSQRGLSKKGVCCSGSQRFHRSKSWAWEWLKRYDKEGINGLKTRPKSGRPSKLSEEIDYRIKEELKESNQGWTTKQVEELIIKKSGIKYHYIHIYRILRKWGFKQKVPRKVHVNTASKEEKEDFKKRLPRYLWISINNKSSKSSKSSSKKMALR